MNAMTALPGEFEKILQGTFKPDRAPYEVTSESMLLFFLNAYVPEFRLWGTGEYPKSKPVQRLLKEFRDSECRIFIIEHAGKRYILRNIRTATIDVRVYFFSTRGTRRRVTSVLRLIEYHLEDGAEVAREYDNSMSEKAAHGESFLDTAIRALRQELGIILSEQHARRPFLFPMAEFPDVTEYKPTQKVEHLPNEPNIHWTKRYPGIYKRNDLAHFKFLMSLEHYRPEGYHEPETNHYFRWEGRMGAIPER